MRGAAADGPSDPYEAFLSGLEEQVSSDEEPYRERRGFDDGGDDEEGDEDEDEADNCDEEEEEQYVKMCRCGGVYMLYTTQIMQGLSCKQDLLINCSNCSLRVQVYIITDDTD